MPDFLLELRSEEIPARMQARARADLARLFTEHLAAAGLAATGIETHATPRRLALIARGLPDATQTTAEERRGPRADAPEQALAGFLKSTGLTRDRLEERTDKKGSFLYATIRTPGRPTIDVLAAAIPAIVRVFPWPKSMRWGDASASTESLRWVRPLQGIVALFGEHIVSCEVAGITSGAATVGHRFHHPGVITIGGADDYEAKLRACHVILDADERASIIRDGARAAATAAGLVLVQDEGLVAENAGLTEWPMPLLGRFDPAFLDVPSEVIKLTMRTNQKYFACTNPPRNGEGDHAQHGGGAASLAPAFICTANIAATDGGAAIVAGNERVLSARLADAKFFWEADLQVPMETQAARLDQIVFHEKLGTVADKVDRVAKLARWLVEEGIIKPKHADRTTPPVHVERSRDTPSSAAEITGEKSLDGARQGLSTSLEIDGGVAELATLADRAARLCKADLVTQMVAEFPELQGTIGAHLARAQGEDPRVCDAIRDHYKPVGQGDDVPTAPVTVAVSLADKLDTILSFFAIDERPTGSKDPFALRRAALGVLSVLAMHEIRLSIWNVMSRWFFVAVQTAVANGPDVRLSLLNSPVRNAAVHDEDYRSLLEALELGVELWEELDVYTFSSQTYALHDTLMPFFADRLKVQQREAGVRHDLIDAVFALGGEDDLVRLLARVHALQAFVETPEGRDLLAGYKRAANILKKEGYGQGAPPAQPSAPAKAGAQMQQEELGSRLRGSTSEKISLSYTPEPAEDALIAALDSAEPRVAAAIGTEDFTTAMAALASLRAPVDLFFETVTVNDPDPVRRAARLALLARMRVAVHAVADFSKIEG